MNCESCRNGNTVDGGIPYANLAMEYGMYQRVYACVETCSIDENGKKEMKSDDDEGKIPE
jgi:hypothetical protein